MNFTGLELLAAFHFGVAASWYGLPEFRIQSNNK